SGIACPNRERWLPRRRHGSFLACARSRAYVRHRVGRRGLHQSDAGPPRLSRDDGKLFRGESEVVQTTPVAAEKKETGRDNQHRRSLWTAVAREDRQESFGSDFRNGSARRFPGIQLSNGIWRNLVSARRARQKLSHPRAIDRPVQRCELVS